MSRPPLSPAGGVAPPIVWSIAGSDSGGGAGIQADLRAIGAFGLHGCSAIAALTAQNSVAVQRVEPVSTAMLEAQFAALADDLPPHAIKTGVLGSVDNLRLVARVIDRLRERRPTALVVDPVWRATTGAGLGDDAMRREFMQTLLPRATLVTPNRQEAEWLLGCHGGPTPDMARRVQRCGVAAVVVTGGDAAGPCADDWAETPEASGWLRLPRIDTPHHHGSGCVFSASAAAALALGFCTADAAVLAKMATAEALRQGYAAGAGAGPVRPERGFGLHRRNVPLLGPRFEENAAPFPPLVDRWLGLYAIVDSAAWIERVLAAGVRTVQLRIKHAMPAADLSREVERSVRAARAWGAQLFINDHWALAIEHGAYGVHLGQEDLQCADLGALRSAGLRLGVSTHSPWEVCHAQAVQPSYIACGPVHPTLTKSMPWRSQGEHNLAYWCHTLSQPVVAIAGMDAARGREAVRCGAAGVAVLRGIVQADIPEQAVAGFTAALAAARRDPPREVPWLPRSTFAGPVVAPD